MLAFGSIALRCNALAFRWWDGPPVSICSSRTSARARDASVLSAARQGVFFLPLILILPHFLAQLGVQLSQPLSDLCTFILSIPMGIAILRELKEK